MKIFNYPPPLKYYQPLLPKNIKISYAPLNKSDHALELNLNHSRKLISTTTELLLKKTLTPPPPPAFLKYSQPYILHSEKSNILMCTPPPPLPRTHQQPPPLNPTLPSPTPNTRFLFPFPLPRHPRPPLPQQSHIAHIVSRRAHKSTGPGRNHRT